MDPFRDAETGGEAFDELSLTGAKIADETDHEPRMSLGGEFRTEAKRLFRTFGNVCNHGREVRAPRVYRAGGGRAAV